MLSLPFVFGTALDTVPATVPYLFVPDNLKAKWAAALPPRDGRPRVGLVWSGSLFQNTNRGDLRAKQRNIALKQLQAITDRTDIQLVNLQMGDDAAQIDALGLRDRFANPMSNVNDLLDTAAIIENLDLVISVDTSVVHLAGALGKPVWVLSRYDACWRWLRNRSDSPWYPTARVFGQKTPGDWVPVVQNVAAALDEFKPQ
jgi:ADP-heptose:LPS heptosyltransferase